MRKSLESLKNNRAPGGDEISGELLKYGTPLLHKNANFQILSRYRAESRGRNRWRERERERERERDRERERERERERKEWVTRDRYENVNTILRKFKYNSYENVNIILRKCRIYYINFAKPKTEKKNRMDA